MEKENNKQPVNEFSSYVNYKLNKKKDKEYYLKKEYFVKKGFTEEQFENMWKTDLVWRNYELEKGLKNAEIIMDITIWVSFVFYGINIGIGLLDVTNKIFSMSLCVFFFAVTLQMVVLIKSRIKLKKYKLELLNE